jgi:outer membrane receptor protein involved in Fe transport
MYKGNSRIRWVYLIGAGILAISSNGAASAQDHPGANAEETSAPGEIIVTAQKREQRLNDVGMSISALSGDQLAQRGIQSVADLAKAVPGFVVTPSNVAAPVYTIRGVGFYESSLASPPAVTVYSDEVPLAYPALTANADLDVERVEVLKGPQGLVFGQNSTGGAINFIAAKPTGSLKAGVDLSTERFGLVNYSGFVSGPLSDKIRARIAIRGASGGDWQYSTSRSDKLGAQDMIQGRILVDFDATDRLTFRLNVNGYRDKSDPQAVQVTAITPIILSQLSPIVANYPLSPDDARAADWQAGKQVRNNTFYHASLRTAYELSDNINFTSITAFSKFKQYQYQGLGFPVAVGDPLAEGNIKTFSQELRLSGDGGRLNWIVGGNYGKDTINDINSGDTGVASSNPFIDGPTLQFVNNALFGIPFGSAASTKWDGRNYPNGLLYGFGHASVITKARTLAAFANAEYKITDALTAQAGLRYTDDKREATHCNSGDRALSDTFEILGLLLYGKANSIPDGGCFTFSSAGIPGSTSGQLHQHNLSWRVGLNWKAGPDTLLYANVSRGYKAGSFPTIASAQQTQFFPATQERLTAFEAGFKTSILDRHIQINGAAFYYDYRDKQLRGKAFIVPFGNLDRLLNIPKSRLWGVEGQITATPISGLELDIGATYLNSKITSDFSSIAQDSADIANVRGNVYPYTPKFSVVSNAQYSFPLNEKGLTGFIGTGISHNSSSTADINNAPNFKLPSYTLVDIRAGIAGANDSWRFTAFGKNIFNTFYWTNVSHYYDNNARWTGRPVTYGVALALRY